MKKLYIFFITALSAFAGMQLVSGNTESIAPVSGQIYKEDVGAPEINATDIAVETSASLISQEKKSFDKKAKDDVVAVKKAGTKYDARLASLVIPSIKLDSPIHPLGLNDKGEMDVPSGDTDHVGWYEYGTMPGEAGSAVMDAHVFAAFSNLKNVRVGDELYVLMTDGTKRKFRVYETTVYPMAEVPLKRIFNGKGGRFLNFITCSGNIIKTADGTTTYDKRLIVYTELI